MGIGSTARKPVGQQTAYLQVTALGATGNQTVSLGWVPAGANIRRIGTSVRTVFAGGSPTVSFGTRASPAVFFAANLVPVTTLGANVVAILGVAAVSPLVDTELVAAIAGGPTSGDLDFIVEYTCPDATP